MFINVYIYSNLKIFLKWPESNRVFNNFAAAFVDFFFFFFNLQVIFLWHTKKSSQVCVSVMQLLFLCVSTCVFNLAQQPKMWRLRLVFPRGSCGCVPRPPSTQSRPANFLTSGSEHAVDLFTSWKALFFILFYFKNFLEGTVCNFPHWEERLCLGFNFSSALPRCWGFSLGLTRESLRYHFRLMVRRIWPWAQPLQPSQPIIFALPPAPVSIASLASGGRFDMLMPSGAPDSAEIILMLFFLTAALAAWIFT